MYVCMDGCTGFCMYVCMYVCMYGWMDVGYILHGRRMWIRKEDVSLTYECIPD